MSDAIAPTPRVTAISEQLLSVVPLSVSRCETKRSIATLLGISTKELRERLKDDSDPLAEAWADGLERLEARLLRVVLNEAESDSKQRLSAAKYLLDSKFGYSDRKADQGQSAQVAITFVMPKPEALSTFLDRTGAIDSGESNE
tara:strand:+ start:6782 stop:7213 length:432 start_codon:yes stop_codon:yes gene_type:complete